MIALERQVEIVTDAFRRDLARAVEEKKCCEIGVKLKHGKISIYYGAETKTVEALDRELAKVS